MPRKSNAAARRQAKRERSLQRRLRIAEHQAAEYRRQFPEPATTPFPAFPTRAASVPSAVLGHRPTRFVLDIEADEGAIEALGLTRGLWA